MKYLSFFTAVIFALGAHAQSASSSGSVDANAAAQAANATSSVSSSTASQASGSATASAAQATNLSAELTKKLDTKNAKVGDEVTARTTSAARLSDGTSLPKGTRLMGKVTDVQAKSAGEKASRLAFAFDHAILRNGNQLPIRATVMSLTAPVSAAAMTDNSDTMGANAGPAPVAASGGGRTSGGGLLGGATGAAGGVARSAGSAVGTTASGVTSATDNTLHSVSNAGLNGPGNAAANVTGKVTNLPGVNFSADGSASQSAVLNAQGKNFSLVSGTQMMLNVSASNR